MPTPDMQMPVVEALIQWLNHGGPDWWVGRDEDAPLYQQSFSFSGDVYYTLFVPLDSDEEYWISPEQSEETKLFNPFIEGNYTLQPDSYEEFEGNRGTIYLTKEKGTGQKILWLPESVLEENGRFTVDRGFENQRYEYMDTFPKGDIPEIFLVADYSHYLPKPESRNLLNWAEVPETLLRR